MEESMIAGSKAWQTEQRRLHRESVKGAIQQAMTSDEESRQWQAEELSNTAQADIDRRQCQTDAMKATLEMFKQ